MLAQHEVIQTCPDCGDELEDDAFCFTCRWRRAEGRRDDIVSVPIQLQLPTDEPTSPCCPACGNAVLAPGPCADCRPENGSAAAPASAPEPLPLDLDGDTPADEDPRADAGTDRGRAELVRKLREMDASPAIPQDTRPPSGSERPPAAEEPDEPDTTEASEPETPESEEPEPAKGEDPGEPEAPEPEAPEPPAAAAKARSKRPAPKTDTSELRAAPRVVRRRGFVRRAAASLGLPVWALGVIVGVVVLLAVATGAIARLRATPPPAPNPVVAMAPVGPEGATLPFDAGAELVIPPGAVDGTRTISIHRLEGAASPAGVYGPYAFDPPDLSFDRPVEIVLPLPEDVGVTDVVLTTPAGPRQLDADIDPLARTITVRTTDFGSWASVTPRFTEPRPVIPPDGDLTPDP